MTNQNEANKKLTNKMGITFDTDFIEDLKNKIEKEETVKLEDYIDERRRSPSHAGDQFVSAQKNKTNDGNSTTVNTGGSMMMRDDK